MTASFQSIDSVSVDTLSTIEDIRHAKLMERIEKLIQTIDVDSLPEYWSSRDLLATNKVQNSKINKSNKSGLNYRTASLSLLPAHYSGHSVCPNFIDCWKSCIGINSGLNIQDNSILGKLTRTLFFKAFPQLFLMQLNKELKRFNRLCQKTGVIPTVRLNTFSDIPYEYKGFEIDGEIKNVISDNPTIQFYDYSKIRGRGKFASYPNYDITLSAIAKRHDFDNLMTMTKDFRVAIVVTEEIFNEYFAEMELMEFFERNGVAYYNGDKTDMTFIHPKYKTFLILKEKSTYKDKGINPLVYRTRESIGL